MIAICKRTEGNCLCSELYSSQQHTRNMLSEKKLLTELHVLNTEKSFTFFIIIYFI